MKKIFEKKRATITYRGTFFQSTGRCNPPLVWQYTVFFDKFQLKKVQTVFKGNTQSFQKMTFELAGFLKYGKKSEWLFQSESFQKVENCSDQFQSVKYVSGTYKL